jgi:hypothetical protein
MGALNSSYFLQTVGLFVHGLAHGGIAFHIRSGMDSLKEETVEGSQHVRPLIFLTLVS